MRLNYDARSNWLGLKDAACSSCFTSMGSENQRQSQVRVLRIMLSWDLEDQLWERFHACCIDRGTVHCAV